MKIGLGKRWWILLGTAIPVLALLVLLVWASAKSGGNPGGLAVNSELGEVSSSVDFARDFSLELLNGQTLTLSELEGKIVMLDFWASWCAPCRQEASVLANVYREFGGLPVEFIGVDIWDSREDARRFVSQFDVPYPTGVDAKGTIAIDYGVRGIPEKFFISPDGAILKKFTGPMNEDSLRTILDGLLAAMPSE